MKREKEEWNKEKKTSSLFDSGKSNCKGKEKREKERGGRYGDWVSTV